MQQLHARKGWLIVKCSEGDADLVCSGGSSRVIEVCRQPIVYIVPLQVHFCLGLLARIVQLLPATANLAVPDRLMILLCLCSYWHTILLDQPRNLAKSVTTE